MRSTLCHIFNKENPRQVNYNIFSIHYSEKIDMQRY